MAVFDINGNNVGGNSLLQNSFIERGVFRGVQYYIVKINKEKYDGTRQYPFVIAPNGAGPATTSALSYALSHNYPIICNAGIFDNVAGSKTLTPWGILIVNGEILQNTPAPGGRVRKPLLIDQNGDLSYAATNVDATTLTGIVSAVCGFGPLVINYAGISEADYVNPVDWTSDKQRLIIGQFGSGDYAIIASEGRGFDNTTPGWTIPDTIAFCNGINLKFAFELDGGGSTELVVDKKQLNMIYENASGRLVPTYIVFNGTTTYGEPEQ